MSFTLGRMLRYICEPRDQVPRLRGDSRELFSAQSWRHIKLQIMVRAREGALLGDVFISEMLSILEFSMGSPPRCHHLHRQILDAQVAPQ